MQYSELRIITLLFADDVALMAPLICALQHSLDCFTVNCKEAVMRIGISKSEAMVLSRKMVDSPFREGNESLAQVKGFRYFRVLFTSEGTMEHEMSQRIRAAGMVLHSLYCSL